MNKCQLQKTKFIMKQEEDHYSTSKKIKKWIDFKKEKENAIMDYIEKKRVQRRAEFAAKLLYLN